MGCLMRTQRAHQRLIHVFLLVLRQLVLGQFQVNQQQPPPLPEASSEVCFGVDRFSGFLIYSEPCLLKLLDFWLVEFCFVLMYRTYVWNYTPCRSAEFKRPLLVFMRLFNRPTCNQALEKLAAEVPGWMWEAWPLPFPWGGCAWPWPSTP